MAETGSSKSGKKVVRVEETAASRAEEKEMGSDWKPTPQAKSQATTFRIIAVVLWALAIGTEAFEVFWVLKQNPVNMFLLIGLLVAIGLLAVGGSLLWKRANVLDPASKTDTVRFFVRNQLGAIITVVAFLPLIVLIFTNKNMDGKQKGIAGAIGIVLLLVAGYFGTSINPPSTQQYTQETQLVEQYTGQDLVYWTKAGKVYHLCQDASAVNLESKDNQIYSGTVAEAHAAGKERLTLQVDQEATQCGFTLNTGAPAANPTPTP
ncbi:hypothetical protein BH11ACT4_BH11ACT4_20300 [soil metagenome]